MGISPLLTDLYEITMLYAYFKNGKTEEASFELFTRELPKNRNYLIFAGLPWVVEFVENLHFSNEDIDYIYSLKIFPDDFLDFLKGFRFTGKIYSMKEGEIFFQNEPVIRVEAPIYQAQLLETTLMNQVHISSLIASKAARVYTVSGGRKLADFSLRRTHGVDAGIKVAYSTYLAGFDGTSNVLAGKLFGIPVIGTVAHSFIMAFNSEEEAFRAYLKAFPEKAVLLVDTYDTVEGVKRAIRVAKELGVKLKGIRLDSGDVVKLSKVARELLDEAGFTDCKIIVSGGLDEYRIAQIVREGAPVDSFGVGTKVGTSADSPYIDFVYKLVQIGNRPIMKMSPGKKMYPGKKQVFRQEGQDLLTLESEKHTGKPLLELVVKDGKRVKNLPTLTEAREYCLENLSKLPPQLKDIYSKAYYPVVVSKELEELYEKLEKELTEDQ
ncbi:nicotinate phosphoribosyltransferase [Thermovibrio guaymasensis]|uniref:Nicotinate phosphoribosyltransferase n=1 Tax=Thermovibrio guaymasensis TaxID=240167 RepID=A0A420WA11_9BACT|nr:nicotinate phosphoribosyltransferase [Thermovibrio guaymasensis]RKQ64124.1 nicotinate phosphoribosyltransferase [Thermovibrio guaymasensis]